MANVASAIGMPLRSHWVYTLISGEKTTASESTTFKAALSFGVPSMVIGGASAIIFRLRTGIVALEERDSTVPCWSLKVTLTLIAFPTSNWLRV